MLTRGQAMGDAIGHYKREIAPIHAGTVVGFCVSVSHAEAMAAAYRDAGVPAASLDGKTDRAIRRQLLRDLGDGTLKALFSCEIISEGTDIPSVTGAQLLRPTDSLTLYLQQVGRALRVSPGKPHAVILDHVGNSHRHGLPTDPREWSLEGKVGRKTGERPPSVKVCSQCFCAMPSGKPVCPECGHAFTPQPREIVHVPGELEEIQARQQRRAEQSSAQSYEDLVRIGHRRGMANPRAWARHVLAAREAKRERSGVARVVA
jgi:superfamily II DNA or RNA helicase